MMVMAVAWTGAIGFFPIRQEIVIWLQNRLTATSVGPASIGF